MTHDETSSTGRSAFNAGRTQQLREVRARLCDELRDRTTSDHLPEDDGLVKAI